MVLKPPAGSNISVTSKGATPVITIPQAAAGAARIFSGLFLLGWLIAWFFALWDVGLKLWSKDELDLFLFGWLIAWIAGGGFAAYHLFRMARPSVPETLELLP